MNLSYSTTYLAIVIITISRALPSTIASITKQRDHGDDERAAYMYNDGKEL